MTSGVPLKNEAWFNIWKIKDIHRYQWTEKKNHTIIAKMREGV